MTPQLAAEIVRAVEAIVGVSGLNVILDNNCTGCVATVSAVCGSSASRVVVDFGSLRSDSTYAVALEEDAKLLREQLGQERSRNVCTKVRPMPRLEANPPDQRGWAHPDARLKRIKDCDRPSPSPMACYVCPNCEQEFWEEIPEGQ